MYSLTIQAETPDELKKKSFDLAAIFHTSSLITENIEGSLPKEKKPRKPKNETVEDFKEVKNSESENNSQEITYDDVKNITLKLAGVSRATALGVLAKFREVKLVTDLKPEEWADFIKEANATLEVLNKEELA